MADIQDTDLFLVNRNNVTRTVPASNLMADILDDDLMLINRSGKSYKVTCADVKDQLGGGGLNPRPDDITSNPPIGSGTGTEDDPFILTTKTVRPAGTTTSSDEFITITVPEAEPGTSVTWTDNSVGAGDRFAQPSGTVAADGTWSGRLVYNDTPATNTDQMYTGKLQIGITHFEWVILQKVSAVEPPVIDSFDVVENNPDGVRFTNKDFDAALVMSSDGPPLATKTFDAKVEGSILAPTLTNTISSVDSFAEIPDSYVKSTDPTSSKSINYSGTAFVGLYNGYIYRLFGAQDASDNTAWQRGASVSLNNDVEVFTTTTAGELVVAQVGAYTTRRSTDYGATVSSVSLSRSESWSFGYAGARAIFAWTNYWDYCERSTNGGASYTALDSSFRPSRDYMGPHNWYHKATNTFIIVGQDKVRKSTNNAVTFVNVTNAAYNAHGAERCCCVSDTTNYAYFGYTNNKIVRVTYDAATQYGAWNGGGDSSSTVSKMWVAKGILFVVSGNMLRMIKESDFSGSTTASDWTTVSWPYPNENWPTIAVAAGDKDLVAWQTAAGFAMADLATTTSLNFSGTKDLDKFKAGDLLTQSNNAASGTIETISGTNVGLTDSSGTWSVGQTAYGPDKPVANTTKYLEFDSNGNVTDLLDAPQDPPYTTTDEDPTLTLTFPGTFPSGNTPDEELTEGTVLTVSVDVENISGTDSAEDSVQPEGIPTKTDGIFAVKTYIGTSGTQVITTGVNTALGGSGGGLVWLKCRDQSYGNYLASPEWVETTCDYLSSDAPSAVRNEASGTSGLTVFKTTGFTLAGDFGNANRNNLLYVSWSFAKQRGFFTCVPYEIPNEAVQERTIPHDLGTVPGCIIIKALGRNTAWNVWHQSMNGQTGILNETGGFFADNRIKAVNGADFQISTSDQINYQGAKFVAYVFGDTDGLIKCGSFITNPGSSGSQIDCGFEPAFLMYKNASNTSDWSIVDNERPSKELKANSTGTEQPNSVISFNATGFTHLFGTSATETTVFIAVAKPLDGFRSMTQDQFDESSAKFDTYSNRRDVYQGQLAAQRLEEQGYGLSDLF